MQEGNGPVAGDVLFYSGSYLGTWESLLLFFLPVYGLYELGFLLLFPFWVSVLRFGLGYAV